VDLLLGSEGYVCIIGKLPVELGHEPLIGRTGTETTGSQGDRHSEHLCLSRIGVEALRTSVADKCLDEGAEAVAGHRITSSAILAAIRRARC
jgi:hypothetical protein